MENQSLSKQVKNSSSNSIKYYSYNFYKTNTDNGAKVARELYLIINNIIKPKSVVDVGCASGIFLKQFKKAKILGIDGFWIKDEQLQIPRKNFLRLDFTKKLPKLDKKFDVAMCFETAEHLDKIYANNFIKFLCSLSDVVIFGAAIPKQIGTHHVNEQWQSYWAQKFSKNGYEHIDCIRGRLQQKLPLGVGGPYKQNILMYVKKDKASQFKNANMPILDLVSPDYWLERNNPKFVPYHLIIGGAVNLPYKLIRYLKIKLL